MTIKFRRAASIIVLLLVVSLTTGCLGIFKKKTYSLEVTWNKDFGNVVLPDNADKIQSGSVVEIKAEPKEGYAFIEWKGDGITDKNKRDNPLKIKVDKNMKLEAVFVSEDELVFYALNLEFDESQGTVAGLPEDPNKILEGTKLNLVAKPNTGYRFGNWDGDVGENDPNSDKLELVVNDNLEIGLAFTAVPENEVLYSDFENGLSGWGAANASAETSQEMARAGSSSAKVTVEEKEEGKWEWNHFSRRLIFGDESVIEIGKKYELTAWIYMDTNEEVGINVVRYRDGTDGGWHRLAEVTVPPKAWTAITTEFVPEELLENEWTLIIESAQRGVVYYVDDVSIVLVE